MAIPTLSSLAPATTAATALSNLILVSPQSNIGYQPQNPPDNAGAKLPPAILFNYEGEQALQLQSDITDHFVEDNTSIADQIALKPETYTTHGFIGELTDIAPPALAALKAIADKLTTISAYTPGLSTTALIAYNNAFQLYQVASNAANAAVSAWSSITGSGRSQTKQQIALQQFYGYWRARTLFTIQTPWAIFKDMAIQNVRAIQDGETRMITDFEVQFKIIRTAETLTTIVPTSVQGRLNSQSSGLTDLGTSTPAPSISLGQGLASNYPGSFAGVA